MELGVVIKSELFGRRGKKTQGGKCKTLMSFCEYLYVCVRWRVRQSKEEAQKGAYTVRVAALRYYAVGDGSWVCVDRSLF